MALSSCPTFENPESLLENTIVNICLSNTLYSSPLYPPHLHPKLRFRLTLCYQQLWKATPILHFRHAHRTILIFLISWPLRHQVNFTKTTILCHRSFLDRRSIKRRIWNTMSCAPKPLRGLFEHFPASLPPMICLRPPSHCLRSAAGSH